MCSVSQLVKPEPPIWSGSSSSSKKGSSATLISTRGVDPDPGGEMLPESKFFEYIQVNLEYFIFKIFL